ncbi:hypothetical protein O181_020827 [Austropuccinia psidii MF-1]|uniref:Uncharacterized protein n=1 Tax=Austropuccinia psidii MF-1 TaxID=1389203 RepID=A0A9Q3CEA0_9BASI|nr:hypothetical protein [Austropuccinia psidii MF-1]
MVISATIAAAFFIRSLNQEQDLSGLIQTLYNINLFDLNSVLKHVAVEHCRQGTLQDQALLLDKQSKTDKSKPPKQARNCGKGKAPTRGQNKNRSNPNQRKDEDSLKRLEKPEKILSKFELTSKNPNVNVVAEQSEEPSGEIQQSDSEAYVVKVEVLRIVSGGSEKIYLDSGAGHSVVNNPGYLTTIFKAPLHASLLLNLPPPQYLQLRSPNDFLLKCHATIQTTPEPGKIIPFGIKVVVRNENTASKVNSMGHSMKALTFEPFSHALRVLDPLTGRVRVTWDYSQLRSETSVIL